MANLDIYSNLTQVVSLFSVADGATSGLVGIAILLMVGFGTLLLLSAFNKNDAFVAASFVSLLMSLFLKYLNMLNDQVIIITLIIFLFSLIIAYTSKPSLGA